MNPQFLFTALLMLAVSSLDAAETFQTIPIQEGGRKKPFSTFARETLQSMSGRQSFAAADGEKLNAIETVLSMWLQPQQWFERPLILINYKPLKERLELPADEKRFSYQELVGNAAFRQELREVQMLRAKDPNAQLNRLQKEVQDVAMRLALFENVTSGEAFAFVPHPSKAEGRWLTVDAAGAVYPQEKAARVKNAYSALAESFRSGDREEFVAASEDFASALADLNPDLYPSAAMMKLEDVYQRLHPFRWAWVLYLAAAVTLALTSLSARRIGYRAAWIFVIGGFLLQLIGFVCRVLISGRAPVTNMYETVIWVAFGTILFAIILEAIYRCRYFLLGATPVAVVSLILADTQPTILNSAITPLVPVLRSNFWLSTHVTSITLSYAAFALALGVGHIILGKVLLGRAPSAALYNYLYRALQIGVLLLAIGTILGGVWANYSWGRFWGWDPKETWALIALLGYLLVLHGRIAGWWNGFGLAVGSVIGFQSVVMAWYGVNFVLGQGLHSYGFGTGGFPYVAGFCAVEVLFVGAALYKWHALQEVPVAEESKLEFVNK